MNCKEDQITKPLDFVNQQLNSLTPVQLDNVWASGKNKECLQKLSKSFFSSLAKDKNLNMVLSRFVTDERTAELCIQYNNAAQTLLSELDLYSEADIRIIPCIANCIREGCKNNTSYS